MIREPVAPRLLRRFGRMLAMGFVVIYGVFLVQSLIDEPSAAYVGLLAALAIAAAGAVAAWVDDCVGGGLLLLSAVAMALSGAIFAVKDATTAILYLSVPFLLAGLSVLVARGLSARREEQPGR